MDVLLANPRGFCAGVDRAIEIVERALEIYGAPIYVRHEVVHNRFVVDGLREKGAVFVEELDEVPDGATVIFSAHGVSQAVRHEAERRGLSVFDATCPLVTKVHLEVTRYCKEGRETVLIGHAGHPEVEGTMGQYDRSQGGEIYVTQTTLSMDDTADVIDALREAFPAIHGPRKDDICYATQNRQDAVKSLADECDLILVVGSPNSSNSNRLREIAQKRGTNAYLIDGPADIRDAWLSGKNHIGVTAGASAPEVLVKQVVEALRARGMDQVSEAKGREEHITFSLPNALRGD
ncbi:MAG: 4-hydroxy-3-methylbut-2-enyl diphosphate reductase [Gammaproteobacteria bacterium]